MFAACMDHRHELSEKQRSCEHLKIVKMKKVV